MQSKSSANLWNIFIRIQFDNKAFQFKISFHYGYITKDIFFYFEALHNLYAKFSTFL